MSQRYQGGILGVGFNPLQAPNAPTNVTAAGGDASATVSFTAPANVGGSAITGYTGQSNPGGIAATASASPLTFSGLTNGTSYTFNVWALNSYGPSPSGGPSGAVTPELPAPSRAFITWTNDGSSYRTDASVGTVSGSTTLTLSSLGQLVASQAGTSVGLSVCFDTVNKVFVYVYRDNADSNRGKAVVVKPNGTFTSLTIGTPATFASASIEQPIVTYIGSGKIAVIYSNGSEATISVGTVSGTSITFSTAVAVTSGLDMRNDCFGIASDGAGGVLYAYMDGSNGFGYVKAATVSGTTPTWGSAVAFSTSGVARWSALAYSTNAGKYALVYQTNASADGLGRVVTVSGTSISLSSPTTYETGTVVVNAVAYDPTSNAFAILYNELNSGDARVVKATMGSTLSYSSSTVFQSSSTNQTAGVNAVASSSGLGTVVGVNKATDNDVRSAVIDLSGASPVVGTRQTVANSVFYAASIACN